MLAMIKTFCIAAAGGALFFLLHLPMPWMLGPLTAVVIGKAISHQPLPWSVKLRNCGLMLMGYIMGSSFTREALHQIMQQLPAMMFATIATIAFALVLGYAMYRDSGVTMQTILLGSVPGGLTQMTVLAEEIPDTDMSMMTFMQTVRLLSVVFIVPFLALHAPLGAGGVAASAPVSQQILYLTPYNWLIFALVVLISSVMAHRLNTPTPFLLGPVVGSAMLVLSGLHPPKAPAQLVTLAQICIGAYMGMQVDIDVIRKNKKLLPYTIIGGVGVVFVTLLIGYLLAAIYPVDTITAFLSTAPGGMAEMGVTATIVGADISTVTAYQLFRFLFILFVVPVFIRWWLAHVPQRA